MSIKHAAMGLVLLAPVSLAAADLFYKKNLTLHVIHDVEQGESKNSRLDTAVSKYTADAGTVLYLKGQSLYLIRNSCHSGRKTRKPRGIERSYHFKSPRCCPIGFQQSQQVEAFP